MKLLRRFIIGALLLGSPSRIWAQDIVPFDVHHSYAITTCVFNGSEYETVSLTNMKLMEAGAETQEEIKVHEAEHRRQFMADTTLCRDYIAVTFSSSEPSRQQLNNWFKRLLPMETGAYCAGSKVRVRAGTDGTTVYRAYQDILLSQFAGQIAPEVVITAWFDACGRLLGGK